MIRPSRYDRDDQDTIRRIADLMAAAIALIVAIPAVVWFYHTFLQGVN